MSKEVEKTGEFLVALEDLYYLLDHYEVLRLTSRLFREKGVECEHFVKAMEVINIDPAIQNTIQKQITKIAEMIKDLPEYGFFLEPKHRQKLKELHNV